MDACVKQTCRTSWDPSLVVSKSSTILTKVLSFFASAVCTLHASFCALAERVLSTILVIARVLALPTMYST